MRVGRRIGALVVVAAVARSLARRWPTRPWPSSVPTSTVNLGIGGLRDELPLRSAGYRHGHRQRNSGILLPSFTATVSTSVFTPGRGSPAETIAKTSISYWSGPATSSVGSQTPVPGQASAASGREPRSPRPAFSSTGLALSITTRWNPTIVVTIPPAAVAGTYSGTITHSVA